MGVFSKYFRYREAGEDPNVNNVERFGRPFRSLFTSTKVFTLHHRIVIVDELERVAYRAESKAISLHDKTDLFDAYDNPVAHIERKVFTIHERHCVTMADGTYFELSNELFHIFKDITNIEGLGWQLRGNVVGLNFELYDETGGIAAVISQKAISMHDRYCVDVYRPDTEPIVVAILITLQHMLRDRAAKVAAYSQNNN
jgi:uncharacterized protein YxjI